MPALPLSELTCTSSAYPIANVMRSSCAQKRFDRQIMIILETEPKPWTGAESVGQQKGDLGRDGSFAMHDVIDAYRRDAHQPGQRVTAQAQRLHEFFE